MHSCTLAYMREQTTRSNAHSDALHCKDEGGGVGMGSCCAIAAAFSAVLQGLCPCPPPAEHDALPLPPESVIPAAAAAWSQQAGVALEQESARMRRLAMRLSPQPPRPVPPFAGDGRQARLPANSDEGAAPDISRVYCRQGSQTCNKTRPAQVMWKQAAGRPIRPIRVVVMTTATGSYNDFVDPLLTSGQRFFLAGPKYQVSYVVLTDRPPEVASRHARVTFVYRKDLGWPLTALLR